MIALMFLRDDIEARNVAVSLAMENDSLQVIPKGVFRQWQEVARMLDRAHGAILIILNPYVSFDRATLNDIKYLLEQGKKIYVLFPDSFKWKGKLRDNPNIIPIAFKYGDINSITGLISQIQQVLNQYGGKKKKKDSDILGTIVLILLGVLALYGIAFLLGKSDK